MRLSGPGLACIDDAQLGQVLPVMTSPPLTTLHLVRWAAAIEQWHRINFDKEFAVNHDHLPGLPVNGTWRRQFMVQYLTAVVGADGWLCHVDIQFRRLTIVGDVLTAWAEVMSVAMGSQYGEVGLRVGLRDQAGNETSPGFARALLPKRGGAVPYPLRPRR